MATLKQIQFKRSKTAGARPAASVLAEGELAINLKDRTIFTKDDSGNIIDLSISAGGNISGNITQTGDYTQTGKFNLIGPQIVASGGYIEFNYRTIGSGSWSGQHAAKAPIFVDLSSALSASEYNPIIKQRFKDGTFSVGTLVNEGSFKIHYINESGDSKYWTFNRNGNFQVDSGNLLVSGGYLVAQNNIETRTGSLIGPSIITKNISFDAKAFGQYDSQSLVNYVYPGTGETNGVNYLRKVRAKSGGTIYHEICTAQTGLADEVSWWTGNKPLFKLYGIRNDGRMIIRNSLAIGTVTEGYPSSDYGNTGVMGDRYLALGDTASGLKWVRTGVIDLMANGISAATIINNGINSTKKLMVGYSQDSGSTWVFPNNNQAMFTARTDVDGNNNGDGQTHIGYNSNSKMYHYFRGRGRMAVGMAEGLIVEPGILDIKTGSNSVAIRADGTINSTQRISMRTGLFLNGDDNTNALSFKAPTGVDGTKTINWDAGTRNGQNKNTVSIKAWGNAFNSVPGIRETVFEVYDSQGYYFYSQRQRPEGSETVGPVVTQFNGPVNANGSISTAGNLKVDGLSTLNGNVTMKNGLFVQGGSSITGQVKIGGTRDALRIWNAEYGAIFRRSETALHIIPTPKDAGENGGISNLRPLSIALNNGMVQMRHSVTLGDDGRGGNMITVDNDSKLVVVTSNSRISPNFRMQIGHSSYIDAECTNTVRPAGAGSFASQNNEDVRAPFYMNIDRTDTSMYVPILKQRYVQGNSCYSLGTLINGGDFRLQYHEGGDGSSTGAVIKDISWEFKRNGDFYSPGKLGAGTVRIGTDGNITGGSGNFANLNTTLNRKVNSGFITYGKTAGWYKFATVTMPQATSTVSITVTGGNGFNSGSFNQCAISEIVLRTGNNTPKGLNAVLYRRGLNSFRNIAWVNTSGDTYDIYVNMGTYANQLIFNYSSVDNATVQIIGAFSSAQSPVDTLPETNVKGQVADVLTNLVDSGKTKRFVAESEIAINNQTGLRITSNGDKSGSNSVLFRNDGSTFYILLTDKNAADGNTTATEGDWNSKRPFQINMTSGEVTFGNNINISGNGSISWTKAGANPRNMRIFHAGDGTRGNRIEIADETNYIAYFQKLPGGQNQVSFNSATLSGLTQCNQFGVNTTNALGGNSITFGDTDTGIKQNGDGLLDIYANNVQVFRFQNGDLYSYKNINAPNVYIRSDIRLKSNFKPIENALDKVEKLNGVIYDKAEYIGGEAIETEAGIVAQTLQDVLPEAVRETEDSKGNKILTVSSQAQIALLVEAVKTLSSRVKELESKLM
ncbi:TPA: tail fiber domain-containing protein [Escherichia coli]|nr:tail fiber domain-containing protein [Escherichia coli]